MTQPQQLTVQQYVRSLALDFEEGAAQILTDNDIDVLVATNADSEGNFNFIDIAIEYCRAAKYKAVDLTPERAKSFLMREQWLMRERLSSRYANYATTGDTGITITTGGGGVSNFAQLMGFNDLDSVGPADIDETDSMLVYIRLDGTINRISLGALDAFIQTQLASGGITAQAARQLIESLVPAWARDNSIDVPVDQLPIASGSASGIIGPDEFSRIAASIDAATLHDTPQLTADALQDGDAFLLDDASVSVGNQLKEIRVDQLDQRWNRHATALPDAYVTNEEIVVDGVFWESRSGTDFVINLTAGTNPQAGDDDNGFVRGQYGAIEPDVSWINAIYWDDDDQLAKLVINSPTANPGVITVVISDGAGTLTFPATGNNRQVAGTQLLFNTDRVLTITVANPILYWQQDFIRGIDVSLDTAGFGNNLSSADNTLQKAMETLDDLVASGGGGTGDDAYPWATEGNTDDVPLDKLPTIPYSQLEAVTELTSVGPSDLTNTDELVLADESDSHAVKRTAALPFVDSRIVAWARDGNNDLIPAGKLTNAPAPDVTADDVAVTTDEFNRNLTSADDTVQKALNTLDDLMASGGGLSAVASDDTLTGDGTATDTLKVANPFTTGDEAKLDALEQSGIDLISGTFTGYQSAPNQYGDGQGVYGFLRDTTETGWTQNGVMSPQVWDIDGISYSVYALFEDADEVVLYIAGNPQFPNDSVLIINNGHLATSDARFLNTTDTGKPYGIFSWRAKGLISGDDGDSFTFALRQPTTAANYLPSTGQGWLHRDADDEVAYLPLPEATDEVKGIINLEQIPHNSRPDLITQLPASPSLGDTYRVFGVQSYPKVFKASAAVDGQISTTPFDLGDYNALVAYSTSYAGAGSSYLNGRAFLRAKQAGHSIPTDLVVTLDGTEHPVANAIVNAGQPRLFEIPTLSFTDLPAGNYDIRIHTATAAYPADGMVGVAHEETVVTFEGNQTWALSSLYAAPWARQGRPRPVDIRARDVVEDLAVGVSPNTLNALSAGTAPTTVTPNFDLDDNANTFFTGVVTRRIVTRSDNQIGFGPDNLQLERLYLAFEAKDITATYDSGVVTEQGLLVATGAVYRGDTDLGDGNLRAVKDSNGNLQFIAYFARDAGAPTTYNWAETWEVDLWAIPTGGGASQGGGGVPMPTLLGIVTFPATTGNMQSTGLVLPATARWLIIELRVGSTERHVKQWFDAAGFRDLPVAAAGQPRPRNVSMFADVPNSRSNNRLFLGRDSDNTVTYLGSSFAQPGRQLVIEYL